MFLNHFKVIDLTHPLYSSMPTWNGSCGFFLETKEDYDQVFRVQEMKMHAGVGTHMDAPAHRIQGGLFISDISLEQLVVPICVSNVSERAEADYEVSVKDVEDYEKTHGLLAEILLLLLSLDGVVFGQISKHIEM